MLLSIVITLLKVKSVNSQPFWLVTSSSCFRCLRDFLSVQYKECFWGETMTVCHYPNLYDSLRQGYRDMKERSGSSVLQAVQWLTFSPIFRRGHSEQVFHFGLQMCLDDSSHDLVHLKQTEPHSTRIISEVTRREPAECLIETLIMEAVCEN